MTVSPSSTRVTNNQPARMVVRLGLMLAMLWVAPSVADAQAVLATGETTKVEPTAPAKLVSSDSNRIASRRVFVQFPKQSDPSPTPSDLETAAKAKIDAAQEVAGVGDQYVTPKFESQEVSPQSNSKSMSSRGIVPLQTSDISLIAQPIDISTESVGTGLLPEDTAALRAPASSLLQDGAARGFATQQVNWQAPAICYFPLYFEDAMLERHGHVRWGCAQPIVSGVKFVTTIPMLPYLTTLQPPCETNYSLGHFRPGSSAPCLKHHLPWDRRAATVQTLSTAAYFWAAPL